MPRTPKVESLNLEDLGDLSHYEEAELIRLREKLIADVDRIHQESAHHAKRIKELNQARNDLQHELAERARSLRAVKHTITQKARVALSARPSIQRVASHNVQLR